MSQLITALAPSVWVCDDIHSGASADVSFAMPDMAQLAPSWRWLGYNAVSQHQAFPGFTSLVVAEVGTVVGKPLLKAPDFLTQMWEKTGYGGMCVVSYGCNDTDYVAISDMYVRNYFNSVSLSQFPNLVCVRRDVLKPEYYEKTTVWTDAGSGAQDDVSLWSIRDWRLNWSGDTQPDAYLFKAISSYPDTRSAASEITQAYTFDWSQAGYYSEVPSL